MEFKIRENNVLLTTHKTYCDVDECNGLQAVFDYAPFQKFSSECEKRGPVPRSCVIRNIFRVAHRVVGVLMDVEFVDTEGTKLTQTVHLTDHPPAVLFPIIHVADKTYALLVHHRRMASGVQAVTEAITGVVGSHGEFSCIEYQNALQKSGFEVSSSRRISHRAFTIGGDEEGTLGYTFYTMHVERSAEELASLLPLSVSPKTAIDAGNSGCGSVLEPRFCAVSLDEVSAFKDAKASLAACLVSLFPSGSTDSASSSSSCEESTANTNKVDEKENMFFVVRGAAGKLTGGVEENEGSILSHSSEKVSSSKTEKDYVGEMTDEKKKVEPSGSLRGEGFSSAVSPPLSSVEVRGDEQKNIDSSVAQDTAVPYQLMTSTPSAEEEVPVNPTSRDGDTTELRHSRHSSDFEDIVPASIESHTTPDSEEVLRQGRETATVTTTEEDEWEVREPDNYGLIYGDDDLEALSTGEDRAKKKLYDGEKEEGLEMNVGIGESEEDFSENVGRVSLPGSDEDKEDFFKYYPREETSESEAPYDGESEEVEEEEEEEEEEYEEY